MNVSELVELLSEYPGDTEVILDDDGRWREIGGLLPPIRKNRYRVAQAVVIDSGEIIRE